jgi:hypothetical protein
LSLADNNRLIKWLLGEQSVIDVSNIRTLDVKNVGKSFPRLVKSIGSSLRHLAMRNINPNPYTEVWGTPISILMSA